MNVPAGTVGRLNRPRLSVVVATAPPNTTTSAHHDGFELLGNGRHARRDLRIAAVDQHRLFDGIEAESPEEKALLSLREAVELEPPVSAGERPSSSGHGQHLDLIDWLPRGVAHST